MGRREEGTSLLELVFVAGLAGTMAAAAVPSFGTAVDSFRTQGAVRYTVSRLQEARAEAVKRSANTAFRFVRIRDEYTFSVYLDGNGDGVRNQDIERRIDLALRPPERLSAHFPGVHFGASPGLPAPDAGGTPPGDDPIRIGSSSLLAFGTLGTVTPGSLYIRGKGAQYVIRLLGETGRIRILKFDYRDRRWRSL
jgi:type II secretory pathway pseudopilin PulG